MERETGAGGVGEDGGGGEECAEGVEHEEGEEVVAEGGRVRRGVESGGGVGSEVLWV
jgi:hypothetical protein